MNIKVNINGVDYEGDAVTVSNGDTANDIIVTIPKGQTGFERVPRDERYYSVLMNDYRAYREGYDRFDDLVYNEGNYISDQNMTNNYYRTFQLFLRLSRWQAEHDSVPDLKSAFYIRYDYNEEEFYILGNDEVKGVFEIPFSTSENAQLALDKFRPELEWLFTEFKPNLKWR